MGFLVEVLVESPISDNTLKSICNFKFKTQIIKAKLKFQAMQSQEQTQQIKDQTSGSNQTQKQGDLSGKSTKFAK